MSARKAHSTVKTKLAKRNRKELTDDQVQTLIRHVKRAKPLMSNDLMMKLEAAIQKDTFGITRRLALAVLTESGKFMIEKVKNDRQNACAFASLDLGIARYV